jgi:hypothetical protein
VGDQGFVRLVRRSGRTVARPVQHERPAFYALDLGSWRDYVTLLHPPYTLWHLSYVVLGAALAPTIRYDRLGATLVAFFLGLGIAAHALDELSGRPLRTAIPGRMLLFLAVVSLAGAVAIGVAGVIVASPWLIPFIAFGVLIVPAYNLEWFQGRFHSDLWFALAWGVFPFLTAYWASAETLEWPALAGAVAVFALSLAQRTLSSRVRILRRKTRAVAGAITYDDGSTEKMDRQVLIGPDERALMLVVVAVVALSVATLLLRAL